MHSISECAEESIESQGDAKPSFSLTALWICLAIALATFAVYANVRQFEFISLDDHGYPLNWNLRDGFTSKAFHWAFTTGDQGNWHPLTWLSHLLDIQLYGPSGGPHHVSSLVIHVLASLMLFIFLHHATGAVWRSGLVTFLFALHPMHVESVAWVSERKDVLCAFFWFLTSWSWVRYAERPGWWRYLVVLLPFCLGLLSKPMIVTLPFVLLLLDFWPLQCKLSRGLLLEKIPFLGLAAIASFVTFEVQKDAGSVRTLAAFPIGLRIENALITWIVYVAKTIWPVNLPYWYPYEKHIPVWQAAVAALLILAVSLLVIRLARTLPYLAVGWFWYLGTLIPVIGLVQVGMQSRADRYMYIPMVGLSIMLAWGAGSVVERWPATRFWMVSALGLACVGLVADTWVQVQFWKNTETLSSHAIEVSRHNEMAYHALGEVLLAAPGRLPEALGLYDAELRGDPVSAQGHTDRGTVLLTMGRHAEAVAEYRTALSIKPYSYDAHLGYGTALQEEGRSREAIEEFNIAIRVDPANARAFTALGVARMATNQAELAIESYDRALGLDPYAPEAHNDLGTALASEGKFEASLPEFEAAARYKPDFGSALRNRGEALMKLGRMDEAVESFRKALVFDPGDAVLYSMMGFALAHLPQSLPEAVRQFREAVRLNPGLASAQENLGGLLASSPATLPEAIEHVEAALRITHSPATLRYLNELKAARSGRR